MTKGQKAICVFLCLCMLGALAVYMPKKASGPAGEGLELFWEQLPVYAYLEQTMLSSVTVEDPETYAKILESNAQYLQDKVASENQAAGEDGNGQDGSSDSQTSADEENNKIENSVQDSDKVADGQEAEQAAAVTPHPQLDLSLEKLSDYDYLLNNFFVVDPNTATNSEQINAETLLSKDMRIKQDNSAPQILIYHSHSQEEFADSDPDDPDTKVVGVGNTLASILQEQYGYQVIHITDAFDIVDGELDRNRAYDFARAKVEQILEENPSIEVIIDLHRDGVPEDRHLVTEINGKPTAQIMFYNGLSYTVNNGAVEYLPNPYIQDNLAFSFQMQMKAAEYYPTLDRNIYLAGLRYNLHLRPKAVLLECGAQTNTIEEAKNAMVPFADILDRVLKGEE